MILNYFVCLLNVAVSVYAIIMIHKHSNKDKEICRLKKLNDRYEFWIKFNKIFHTDSSRRKVYNLICFKNTNIPVDIFNLIDPTYTVDLKPSDLQYKLPLIVSDLTELKQILVDNYGRELLTEVFFYNLSTFCTIRMCDEYINNNNNNNNINNKK